ncbi:MAG TPA: hypothetical protein VM694_14505 [Polyangium sp.]|nr:hypothetical protein [Polyangium sp.]
MVRAGFALAALLLSPSVARAEGTRVQALFQGDIDARLHSAERVEGEDGFAVARLRLGARADFTPWFHAVAQAEWAQEKPALLDAYVAVRPSPSWEISLGARKTPLFAAARDEPVWMLPVPERPMIVRALWPGRDVGLEVHRLPTPSLPLEAWLRVGNGSGSVLGNDNSDFALDARLDVALGRANPMAKGTPLFGLRLGAGIHVESAEDRIGVRGTTADGFIFYRAATVYGPRRVAEAHTAAYLGPVRILGEIGLAKESRAKDTDGNPATARVAQDAIRSVGGFVEVAWMLTGQRRAPGIWPTERPGRAWGLGALELAGRFERLSLGQGARDVAPGGATSVSAAVRWWAARFCAISAAGYVTAYDTAPIEEPGTTRSWLGIVRATFHVPVEKLVR